MISEERLWKLCSQTMNGPWVDPVSFARAVEVEAYEAAAKECDERHLSNIAAVIRALKKTGAE